MIYFWEKTISSENSQHAGKAVFAIRNANDIRVGTELTEQDARERCAAHNAEEKSPLSVAIKEGRCPGFKTTFYRRLTISK